MTEKAIELFGPVADDLATLEAELRKEIETDPPEVAGPMADLFEAGGKRIRPALVLLAAMCGHYDLGRLTPAAMAVVDACAFRFPSIVNFCADHLISAYGISRCNQP